MPSASPQNVHIIYAVIPSYGHTRPFRMLARAFSALGYSSTFIGGTDYSPGLDQIPGVEFVPLQGKADLTLTPGHPNELKWSEEAYGPDCDIWGLREIFFRFLPEQHNTLHDLLSRPDMVDKKCVLIYDPSFVGALPMLLSAPGIRRIPAIALGHFPLPVLSKDTAPYGLGLPSQGATKNAEMNAAAIERYVPLMSHIDALFQPYNIQKPLPSRYAWETMVLPADRFLQLTVPELEPFRSDLPGHISFAGALYGGNDKKPLPEWFDAFIRDDTTGHPLVLVTSGTIPFHPASDLILPTIDACRGLPLRVVVCGVAVKLPADYILPSNARWAEWIAFEQVFPYTACVVSNGGYNGINQALAAGIPMVLAGTSEDKMEGTTRAAATGAAISLRVQNPSVEQLRTAILEVTATPKYMQEARKLKESFARYDAVKAIREIIDAV